MIRIFTLVAMLFATPSGAAGFQRVTLDGVHGALELGIWYPTDQAPAAVPNTPFGQALALEAPVAGRNLPVVVLSHGHGGWMGGHADTALALAEAGLVAVGLTHPGNNFQDESAPTPVWMETRPADVTVALDYVTAGWPGAGAVDAARIGAFGFSAGGYTVLAAAGAVPDAGRVTDHCREDPEEFICQVGMGSEITQSAKRFAPMGDARIGAVAALAPGLSFAFTPDSLSGIGIPVMLWSGAADDRVPEATNAAYLSAHLPQAQTVTVPDAGHFAFLAPCNPALEQANPRVWQIVCVDAPGFDRATFHVRMNGDLVTFFNAALMGG